MHSRFPFLYFLCLFASFFIIISHFVFLLPSFFPLSLSLSFFLQSLFVSFSFSFYLLPSFLSLPLFLPSFRSLFLPSVLSFISFFLSLLLPSSASYLFLPFGFLLCFPLHLFLLVVRFRIQWTVDNYY